MRDVQDQARLWRPAELVLDHAYSRPGVALVYEGWVSQVNVYYNKYVPGQVDQLRVAGRDAAGQWSDTDTGLDASSVSSGLTAAMDQDTGTIFLAWRSWDNTVRYATKPWFGSWSSVQVAAGEYEDVVASDEPALAGGASDVRLFYREAGTSKLRYLKWTGTGWSGPYTPPGAPEIERSPSASWDGTRFSVATVKGGAHVAREMELLEVTPGQQGDSWSGSYTFSTCAYNTSAHEWSGQAAVEVTGDKLYVVGVKAPWDPYSNELAQAVATRGGGAWTLQHHGRLEITGDAVDTALTPSSFGDLLFMVNWTWSAQGSQAYVRVKKTQ